MKIFLAALCAASFAVKEITFVAKESKAKDSRMKVSQFCQQGDKPYFLCTYLNTVVPYSPSGDELPPLMEAKAGYKFGGSKIFKDSVFASSMDEKHKYLLHSRSLSDPTVKTGSCMLVRGFMVDGS